MNRTPLQPGMRRGAVAKLVSAEIDSAIEHEREPREGISARVGLLYGIHPHDVAYWDWCTGRCDQAERRDALVMTYCMRVRQRLVYRSFIGFADEQDRYTLRQEPLPRLSHFPTV